MYSADEFFFLFTGGKLPIEEQVARFQIIGVVCQLVYRIASVQQYALGAIYEGDL
jgi:hypothetical protein